MTLFACKLVLSSFEHCATLLLRYVSKNYPFFTDLEAEKKSWQNWNFQKSTSKRDEKLNLGSKEKAKHYTSTEITECNKRYIVHKILASLLSLIAKGWTRCLHAKIDSFYCFKKLT